jgi:hypothetical protein
MLVRAIALAAMVIGLSACNMAGVGKAGETPEAADNANGGGDAAAPSADGKPADASAAPSDGGAAKPEEAAPAPQPAPSAKP